ncbi:DUF2087 domain-containing protein, partial [Vibrio parahaemolyticus]|nr:DUF2087 domain-containing protein [Vibrio parahaemolyticus]
LLSKNGLSIRKIKPELRIKLFYHILTTVHISVSVNYTESEITDKLKIWLNKNNLLRTDHCELRRWMVDSLVLLRTPQGDSYSINPELNNTSEH